ncbi:MAG: gamma-glutamyltransferase [Planctomycetes bacterium]|nr:gamma-glutamyltransferase [Planctomycetota bacterium]
MRIRRAGALALLAAAAACAASGAARLLRPRIAEGQGGFVVSDEERASRIGAGMLARGGNAVDAAVATAFALAVTLPEAGNLGGGGFLVAHIGGKSHALDFRETAPAAARRDMYLDARGMATERSLTGHLAAGVPGSVAGLFEAHQKLGQLPWPELVQPAVELAESGFVMDAGLSAVIASERKRLAQFSASADLFLPGGAPVAPGTRWRNPGLAATLRRVAAQGPAGFYSGPTAELLAAEMARGGGAITKDDLLQYKAKWRAPLEISYRDHRIITMPLPSSGGPVLAMALGILEPYSLRALGHGSPSAIHLQAEALRRAFAARNALLGDPEFTPDRTARLRSPEWIEAQRATMRLDRATPSLSIGPGTGDDGGSQKHTTHLSAVDGMGNAVALTTTLNTGFGSAVVVSGAGFLLNNEMDDFAAKPGEPNTFGLVQGEANAIEPGKRMLSSMTPTVVLDPSGRVVLVTGAAGGPTITTAVFQILTARLDFGASAVEAAAGPRFHHQHLPDELRFEPGLLGEEDKAHLESLGHRLVPREKIADAQSILWENGRWVAVADPRRRGAPAAADAIKIAPSAR